MAVPVALPWNAPVGSTGTGASNGGAAGADGSSSQAVARAQSMTAMERNVALTWDWMNVLEASFAPAIQTNMEYDGHGVLLHNDTAWMQTWFVGAPGMPPSAAPPRYQDVLNRGFPPAGRWVYMDQIVVPPDPANGTVPVACMVYWDQSCAGWRRFTALSDCRPRRNVPQPWQPYNENAEASRRHWASQVAVPSGGIEAGWPDLFSRDPAYIQRGRPCSAASSDSGSGHVDERDTSPSARSDFLERVRRGDFATRDQWAPYAAATRADNGAANDGAAASSE